MVTIVKLLTFDGYNELRHHRQDLVRSFGDQVVDALFHNKTEGVRCLRHAVEEHGQVVMEVQLLYRHLRMGNSLLLTNCSL